MGKKKIIRYRDKALKAKEKFLKEAVECEFKSKMIKDIGCICRLENRWTVTCDPNNCPL